MIACCGWHKLCYPLAVMMTKKCTAITDPRELADTLIADFGSVPNAIAEAADQVKRSTNYSSLYSEVLQILVHDVYASA